jgi:hypothetical protein
MPRFPIALAVLLAPVIARAQPDEPTPPPPPPEDPIAECKRMRIELYDRAMRIRDVQERGRYLAWLPDCGMGESPPEAPPPPPSPPRVRYHQSGIALGVSLELVSLPIDVGSSLAALTLPSTHVTIGYQGDAGAIALELDFERVSASSDGGTLALTTALVGISGSTTLARGESGRSELAAVATFAYRLYDAGGGGDTTLDHRLVGRLGPTARYWIAPSFAVSATTALRVDSFAANGGSTTTEVVSLASSFDLLGVF